MLTVLNIDQSERWDMIVRSFRNYDTYWLSGYVRAFILHGDGEPFLIHYEGDQCRGINVIMKRDVASDEHFSGKIPEEKYFDIATPYGYGGWLIEGENTDDLFSEYVQWCADNRIISEFVRFHPIVKNHIICGKFYDIVQMGEVVHMELDSPEIIWKNITSKNRNVIRKAQKNDVRVYNGRYPEIFEIFRQIYNGTMEKDNADPYYYFEPEFYTSILEDLPQNAQLFYAVKDGTVVAGSIILCANGMMDYHLSGSLREYSSLAPTNLILYAAALWGCENGYKSIYLGGGVGSGEDGLFKFKRAFYKGELNHFYLGKKIFSEERYNELMQIRNENIETGFFPAYRA